MEIGLIIILINKFLGTTQSDNFIINIRETVQFTLDHWDCLTSLSIVRLDSQDMHLRNFTFLSRNICVLELELDKMIFIAYKNGVSMI